MPKQNTPLRPKLETAGLLILGMESLSADGITPVSPAAMKDVSAPLDAIDRQRFAMALTCAVLYAIVIELVLKHIWEKESGQTAPYKHIAHRLFAQLSPEVRCEVEALYDQCCLAYKSAIDIGHKQQGAKVVTMEMANLDEALRWNDSAMRDLKYELEPRGKSVPAGIIWSPERIWIVPSTFPHFAITLTRWASLRNFNKPTP